MASKSKTDKPDSDNAEDETRLGKIVNAPSVPNTGGYENRVRQGSREHTGMEGKNNGGFEARVTQEQGTH